MPLSPTDESPVPGRRLKAYDVRRDRDHGRRRHLAQLTRRVLRVSTLVLLDLGVLALALAGALRLTGGELTAWRVLALPVLAIQVLALLLVNAYAAGSYRNDASARVRAVGLTAAVLALQFLLTPALALQPRGILLYALLAIVGLELERGLVQLGVRALRRRGYLVRPTVAVTAAGSASELVRELAGLPHSDLKVVGYLTPPGEAPAGSSTDWPPCRGAASALEDVIRELDVRVVVLGRDLTTEDTERVVARSFEGGCTVIVLPSDARRIASRLAAASPLALDALELFPPRLALPGLSIKRALDVVGALAALLLLSPLLLALALAIKLSSPGRVFFRQTRLGVGGRAFTMYKFRTMEADADARKAELEHMNQYTDGLLFKIKDDPRVTPVGRVLRRSSLDELPQLLNVLRGDMSLVGPRPPVPEEVAGYAEEHLVRLTVIPGMTGPWQVNGRSDLTSFEDVVRLEQDYIRDWSLWLDLKIIGRTLVAVARGEGAR